MLFYCSTKNEFVTHVQTKLKANEGYPFIFIPSGENITYSNRTNFESDVDIKELFICTLRDTDLLASERDKYSFNTILLPLMTNLEAQMRLHPKITVIPTKKRLSFQQFHCYKTETSSFEERLDVVIVQDIKLKIKNC